MAPSRKMVTSSKIIIRSRVITRLKFAGLPDNNLSIPPVEW